MKIPDVWAPMLVSAVRDAVLYQDNLLKSETLRNREDYEAHFLQLTQFFEFIKEEYEASEKKFDIPLKDLL